MVLTDEYPQAPCICTGSFVGRRTTPTHIPPGSRKTCERPTAAWRYASVRNNNSIQLFKSSYYEGIMNNAPWQSPPRSNVLTIAVVTTPHPMGTTVRPGGRLVIQLFFFWRLELPRNAPKTQDLCIPSWEKSKKGKSRGKLCIMKTAKAIMIDLMVTYSA